MIIWYIEKSKTKLLFYLFNNKLSSLNYVKIIISFKWCNIFKIIFNLMKNSYDKNKYSLSNVQNVIIDLRISIESISIWRWKDEWMMNKKKKKYQRGKWKNREKTCWEFIASILLPWNKSKSFCSYFIFHIIIIAFLDTKKLDINFLYYSI